MNKVYLIESNINGTMTYKIGKTTRSVGVRLAELSTGNAGEMRVVCEYETKNASLIELSLHSKFAKYRLAGEWFTDNLTKEEFLNSCIEIDNNIKKLKEMGNPFI